MIPIDLAICDPWILTAFALIPAIIKKKGKKYQLISDNAGKVLGTFDTREEAVAQEKAIKSRMGKVAKRRGSK